MPTVRPFGGIVTELLKPIGDVLTGAVNTVAGIVTLGQSGTIGRGLGQIGGGLGSEADILGTDIMATAYGTIVGKPTSVALGIGNLLTGNSFANNAADPAREARGFLPGVENFARSVIIPTYGFNLGVNWGSPQQGFANPADALSFNNQDRISYNHDIYQNNKQWVTDNLHPTPPPDVIPTGPVGDVMTLIGTVPFWVTPSAIPAQPSPPPPAPRASNGGGGTQ